MMDITRNAVWTQDCCGKQDLDFQVVTASTRYWPDNTAICKILFIDDFVVQTNDYGYYPPILLAEKYIKGSSEGEVKELVRKWYNDNMLSAMKKAMKLLKKNRR